MTTEVTGSTGAPLVAAAPAGPVAFGRSRGKELGRDETGRRGHGVRRHVAGDRRQCARAVALASLVALPLLVYALPAVLGHSVVPGDDLTQNLPLRELVGRDLRSGHLPVFDPYVWGGAPLLGGWNAAAAYPLTWLFALAPGAVAWTVNLVAAAMAAALGTYAFLRASRLGVLASWAGAMTFAFGGAMVAQVPHAGLVIGMSWAPLALLAILRLTAPGDAAWPSRLRWTAVLAVAVGLVLLAGEPRAATNVAVVLTLYGMWRLVRLQRIAATGRHTEPGASAATTRAGASRAASLAAAAAVGSGALLGLGLGAVQLLPGLAAVASSQRAQVSAFLFGAGSLPVHWLALLGVPDLLGGSGSFGQPAFFASYNLTEVTGYVGLLPLVAAIALFARCRRHQPVPDWMVWELVAAAGVLLALGDHTPLWHVLIHIPLFGGQRLQSRSILVTDLALAVLLAYWLDGWTRAPRRSGRPPRGGGEGAVRWERALGALPLVGVAGLVVAAFVAETPLLEWMGVADHAATHVSGLLAWLVPSLVLALGALALVVAGPRLSPGARGSLAAVLVVVDLLVFNVSTVVDLGALPRTSLPAAQAAAPAAGTQPAPGSNDELVAPPTRPLSALHLSGRFAVYDPGLLDPAGLTTLGVPDANVVARTWSVQGYGSIVDGPYAASTGVHGVSGQGQDVFSPRAAANGVFDSLSTQTVLTPSQYLRTPSRGVVDPRSGSAGQRAADRQLRPGATTTWFLGTPLLVRSARVRTRASPSAGGELAGRVRIGLLLEGGRVDWAPAARARAPGSGTARGALTWDAAWPSTRAAVGVVVRSEVAATAASPVVTAVDGQSYALDGVLQPGLLAPHWRYGGQDGDFALFVDEEASAPLSLQALAGEALRGATVRRVAGPRLEPSAALVSSPHGVDVVRAVAAIPGWIASWTPASGPPRRLAVHRLGAVQVVRAPAGRGVVTWRYVAPSLLAGELSSVASVAVVAAIVVAAAVTDRRRRRGAARARRERPDLPVS